MRIGLDIDGTLSNFAELRLAYGQIFNAFTKDKRRLRNPKAMWTQDFFGWSDEEDEQFWAENQDKILNSAPPRPLAKEMVEKLKQDGHQIILLTARNNRFHEEIQEWTRKWLLQNQFSYDELRFDCLQKGEICQDLKIDVFLDDERDNCVATAKAGVKTCIFNEIYNQDFDEKKWGIERVFSWPYFYELVSEELKNE